MAEPSLLDIFSNLLSSGDQKNVRGIEALNTPAGLSQGSFNEGSRALIPMNKQYNPAGPLGDLLGAYSSPELAATILPLAMTLMGGGAPGRSGASIPAPQTEYRLPFTSGATQQTDELMGSLLRNPTHNPVLNVQDVRNLRVPIEAGFARPERFMGMARESESPMIQALSGFQGVNHPYVQQENARMIEELMPYLRAMGHE